MKYKRLERMAINRTPRLSDETKAALVSGFLVLALCLCIALFISVPVIGR